MYDRTPPERLRVKWGAEQAKRQPPLHLSAATDTTETPIAEVLAIVAQQPIIVLPEARAGAPDDLIGRKLRLGMIDDRQRMTVGESSQRHLLHRSALPERREPRVMHHATVADVDAVMAVSSTRCGQVRAERRFPPEP